MIDRRSLQTVAVMFMAVPELAHAQSHPAIEAPENVGSQITVTARKQVEPAAKTPVAVTVFDEDDILRRKADTLEPLARSVANVSYESGANIAGGGRTYTAFIRGIGQTDFLLTIDPGVGLYVDGVYVARTVGGLLDTMDVSSVQVLRGPQGTFFGKNTIGGAILVDSVKPSQEFAGSARLTLGRFDRSEIAGFVNVPLSPVAALRVTINAGRSDGYVKRLSDGGRMGGTRSISGKATLAYEPSPGLSMVLRLDGLHARDEGAPGTMLAATNQIIVPDPHAPPNFGYFYNLTQTNGACGIPPLPPVPPIPACFGPQFVTGNPYTTWAGGPNFSNVDQVGGSLTVDAKVGAVRIRSVTAYRNLDSAFYLDTDASPLTVSETQNKYSYSQFSEELNASGQIGSATEWITGLYYFSEKGRDANELRFSIADFASGGSTANASLAAYGHIKFQIANAFSLALGGRYSHERKRFTPDQFIRIDRTGGSLIALSQLLIPAALNPDGRRILPLVTSRLAVNQFTPTATLTFSPSERAMLYLSYSEGFKSGGFTQRVFPPEAQTPEFGPEKVHNYEAGAKFALPSGLGHVDLTAFYADYSDMQLIINAGLAPQVENAGKARIVGQEIELHLKPLRWLTLDASAGHIDSKYLQVSATAFPVSLASELPNAPRWTLAVGADAAVVERDDFTLRLHSDWTYKSAHYKDANNSAALYQPGYGLLSANVALSLPGLGLEFSAGVTNLMGAKYLVSGYSELALQAAAYGVFGPPRRWFLQLRKDF